MGQWGGRKLASVVAAGAVAIMLSLPSAQSQAASTSSRALAQDRTALLGEILEWQAVPMAFADWVEVEFGPEAGMAGVRLDFEGNRVLLEWSSKKTVPKLIGTEAERLGLNLEVLSAPLDLNEREKLGFAILNLLETEYPQLDVTKVETPDGMDPSVRVSIFGTLPKEAEDIAKRVSTKLNVAGPVKLVLAKSRIHQASLAPLAEDN